MELTKYACLSVGDKFMIEHQNEKYKFEVLECKPETSVGIIDTDLELDFGQPKDYEEIKKNIGNVKINENNSETPDVKIGQKFPGKGIQISGKRKRIERTYLENDKIKEKPYDPRENKIIYKFIKSDSESINLKEDTQNSVSDSYFKGEGINWKGIKKLKEN